MLTLEEIQAVKANIDNISFRSMVKGKRIRVLKIGTISGRL